MQFRPFLGVLIACAALGCGDDAAGNGSELEPAKRVVLRTTVSTDPASLTQFTTNFGWNVSLERAAVGIGALYYFNGPPAFARLERKPSMWQRASALFEGTAYAHPGHYQAGDALGQMLTASSYDLMSPVAAPLADGEGVTGQFRSARFVFASLVTGPAAEALGTHVAYARGTAEKADGSSVAPIHFEIAADFADVAKQAAKGEIDGCSFSEVQVKADGTVHLVIRPAVWFNLVDFSDVAPGTADAPTVLSLAAKSGIGFVNGLTQLDAYTFTYSP